MWVNLDMQPIKRAAERRTRSRQLSWADGRPAETATVVKPGGNETMDKISRSGRSKRASNSA